MRVLVSAVFVCSIVALLLAAGCADINAKQKVGDFGTAFGASPEEQKAIDWFKTTYGDPTANNDQPARFIEPMITTALDADNLPTNKVTTFPVSGGSVYFFVIYDNFKKGDPITVSWTYLENGKVVTSVQQQAGGDFGRFIVEFQKPDSGWGKGKQEITVTGDQASGKVDFTIGDTLQTTPLPYNATPGEGGTGFTGTARLTQTLNPGISEQSFPLNNEHSLAQGGGAVVTTTVTTPAGQQPTGRMTAATTYANANSPNSANVDQCAPLGQTSCDNVCRDLKTDPYNCGTCGNLCTGPLNTKPYCSQGTCTWECLSDYRYCGNTAEGCVPMYNDDNHCGNCNTDCGSGSWCNQTRCENGSRPFHMTIPTGGSSTICGGMVCSPHQSCYDPGNGYPPYCV